MYFKLFYFIISCLSHVNCPVPQCVNSAVLCEMKMVNIIEINVIHVTVGDKYRVRAQINAINHKLIKQSELIY